MCHTTTPTCLLIPSPHRGVAQQKHPSLRHFVPSISANWLMMTTDDASTVHPRQSSHESFSPFRTTGEETESVLNMLKNSFVSSTGGHIRLPLDDPPSNRFSSSTNKDSVRNEHPSTGRFKRNSKAVSEGKEGDRHLARRHSPLGHMLDLLFQLMDIQLEVSIT